MIALTVIKDLIEVVAKSSPILASVLGSPFAGIAIELLSHVFNIPSKDPQDILNAVQQDPESALKIKTLEYQHQETLKNLNVSDEASLVQDRISARQREEILHDHVPTLLALLFLVAYAFIQVYCVMHPNPADDIISARFQDLLVMIFSYYFGSSHQSSGVGKSSK